MTHVECSFSNRMRANCSEAATIPGGDVAPLPLRVTPNRERSPQNLADTFDLGADLRVKSAQRSRSIDRSLARGSEGLPALGSQIAKLSEDAVQVHSFLRSYAALGPIRLNIFAHCEPPFAEPRSYAACNRTSRQL
jgi:hypothetical protein